MVVTLWGKAWTATAADADALPPPRAREDLLLASWLTGCIGVVLCALCVHVLTGGCLWGMCMCLCLRMRLCLLGVCTYKYAYAYVYDVYA